MKKQILLELLEAAKSSGGHNGILTHRFSFKLSKDLVDTLDELRQHSCITQHDGMHGVLNKLTKHGLTVLEKLIENEL